MTSTALSLLHRWLFPCLWIAWAGYWWVSARNVKETVQRESELSRALHLVPLAFAAWLMWTRGALPAALDVRFMPLAEWAFVVGALVAAGGLLFAVQARRHLGRNWSAIVTVKKDHELITSGPYALVRHPIYTGLLLGFAGSALALGQWRGIVATAIVLASLWRKLRLEERWMRARFGPAYDEYARRVKALVPFVL